jgi:DNA-binding transcriptional LysR family regulator
LTESGEFFLEEARRILDSTAVMEQRMARVARGVRGRLAIAFTTSAAAHLLTPRVLRLFRGRYPEIELSLSENSAAEITERIASRDLHCGFLRVPVSRPPGLVFRTLLKEPVLVAAPLDHRLAQKPRTGKNAAVALKDFQDENLILVRRAGAPGLYANLLALCAERGIYPNVVAEVERMMTNLNLVAAGAGISVVPASMQQVHAQTVAYRPLGKSIHLNAPLTLVYRAADETAATGFFVDLVTTTTADGDRARA